MSVEKSPLVAVAILNWNNEELMKDFLPSVLATEYDNFETYVIDNGSTDNSLEMLASKFPTVKIVKLDDNYGFVGGYNRGLKEIPADYFVLLNSDVEVSKDWIEVVIGEMKKDPTVGAAQPKILAQKQKTHFEYAGACGGFLDKWGYSFCRGRLFDDYERDEGQYDEKMEVDWASGCSLFIKSSLYFKVGGLDENFFAHFEEIDLCWRLRRAGYKVMVYPEASVFHVGGATLSAESPFKTYLNFRNNLIMMLKNVPGNQLLQRLFVRLCLDGIAALRFLFSGKFASFKAVVKAHWSFELGIFKYWRSRKAANNLVKENRLGPPRSNQIYSGSILKDYFLSGKRKFSDIIEK